MNNIKSIVEDLNIKSIKEECENKKSLLFKKEREASKLTFNKDVGLYKYYLDEYKYLLNRLNEAKYYNKGIIELKLETILNKLYNLYGNKDIDNYKKLIKEIDYIKDSLNEYNKVININLRDILLFEELPNIYVSIEDNKYKHIINSSLIKDNIDKNDTIIYSYYDIKSNRDYRHFYNRVSYNYLEELTNDYSLELKNKRLGKVRIE